MRKTPNERRLERASLRHILDLRTNLTFKGELARETRARTARRINTELKELRAKINV